MARALRIVYPGAVYPVMNRGASRQAVFSDSVDYMSDCSSCWAMGMPGGGEILAYCLMGNP